MAYNPLIPAFAGMSGVGVFQISPKPHAEIIAGRSGLLKGASRRGATGPQGLPLTNPARPARWPAWV